MRSMQALSSGIEALDALIDGVRCGDNLVVVLDDGIPGDWIVDRFAAAADPSGLIIVDAVGRHPDTAPGSNALRWSVEPEETGIGPGEARAELIAADERVGAGAAFAFNSLTALAQSWGEQAALDLFLWACPRLYRRRSVALWLIRATNHDAAFMRRLTGITQVVVEIRGDGDRVRLEVVKADGRAETVQGRTSDARLEGGDLVDVRPSDARPGRLGASLRDVRTARDLGQAELARRVGISPSALSQAERGVRGVSAETLMRIWEALGVPFGPAAAPARGYRVNRRGARASSSLAKGVTGHRLADEPGTTWQLTFAPRATGRTALFTVKAPEILTVLNGVLQLELAGHEETLHEGDTLVADDAAITGWANPSDTATDVMWIITG